MWLAHSDFKQGLLQYGKHTYFKLAKNNRISKTLCIMMYVYMCYRYVCVFKCTHLYMHMQMEARGLSLNLDSLAGQQDLGGTYLSQAGHTCVHMIWTQLLMSAVATEPPPSQQIL